MANNFKRDVGKGVSKRDADAWIAAYRKAFPDETRSVFYGRDVLERILKDPQFTGISFFFCRKVDEQGKPFNDLVLVGTYEDGSLGNTSGDEKTLDDPGGGGSFNDGTTCPPICPKP